jgi:hypothetical protein
LSSPVMNARRPGSSVSSTSVWRSMSRLELLRSMVRKWSSPRAPASIDRSPSFDCPRSPAEYHSCVILSRIISNRKQRDASSGRGLMRRDPW